MLMLDGVEILFGDIDSFSKNINPLCLFDENVCCFLSSLSNELMSNPICKLYPDIITFAYWCRKSNLYYLKNKYIDEYARLGIGVLFHISPSNVPINFAFSLVFGIISGNSNIVRVPTKNFKQIEIIIEGMNKVSRTNDFVLKRTLIVKYDKNSEVTNNLIKYCDCRVVWGGDNTVNSIRKIESSPMTSELVFPDRYSICLINVDFLTKNVDRDISLLCKNFYNDTYLMDQKACSSPHMIFWVGDQKNIEKCRNIFCLKLGEIVEQKYDFKPIMSIDKYEKLCIDAQSVNVKNFIFYKNYLYLLFLDEMKYSIDCFKGMFGYFYEFYLSDIDSLCPYINKKIQTLTYYGFNKKIFNDFIIRNKPNGIDRIVPIGKALDMSVIWDGMDIIKKMSRICDIL